MRIKSFLVAGFVLAVGIPALAQQGAQPAPAPAPSPAQPVSNTTAPAESLTLSTGPGESETGVEQLPPEQLGPPPPPIEYPANARRAPWVVGRRDPTATGLGPPP